MRLPPAARIILIASLLAALIPVGPLPAAVVAAAPAAAGGKCPAHRRCPQRTPTITIPGRPKPREETFHGCPPQGSGGDTDANLLKNRIDVPSRFRTFSVKQFLHLSWPGDVSQETTPMAKWTKDQRQKIYRYEGMGAALVGYASSFDHTGPVEPTNCMGRGGSDWHLWIAARPHASRKQSIITEAPPRVRARESFNWHVLAALSAHSDKVRVIGWIFFDNDHPVRESDRSTLWEIHPITRIDVWRGGRWVKVAG